MPRGQPHPRPKGERQIAMLGSPRSKGAPTAREPPLPGTTAGESGATTLQLSSPSADRGCRPRTRAPPDTPGRGKADTDLYVATDTPGLRGQETGPRNGLGEPHHQSARLRTCSCVVLCWMHAMVCEVWRVGMKIRCVLN